MPGREQDALVQADQRSVVRGRWPEPREDLLDLEFEHTGDVLGGVAQQVVDREGGDGGVEAALLDGRPEQHTSVGARHEVAAVPAHNAIKQRRFAGLLAQAQQLALDRPHRHVVGAVDLARPGARGEDDLRCGDDRTVLQRHRLAAGDPRDTRAGAQRDTGGTRRRGERGAGCSWVDGVIKRRAERRPQAWSQRRLELTRGGRHEPLHLQPESLTQRQLALHVLGLVAVAGDNQRSALAVADIHAADVRELGGKGGPETRAFQAQHQQVALAGIGLGDRGEHARGDVGRRGDRREFAALAEHHVETAGARPPGDRQPDDASADDYDVCGLVCCTRNDWPPRFAGMTRISC